MQIQEAEQALQEAAETFVSDCLSEHELGVSKRRKVIHDAVWGTHVFSPAEIALLDSPLIQRLRLIHQTALAFYTFPSANHSRLEHTIGVLITATKMAESLQEKDMNLVTPLELKKLRIAALLHDCGHGFFSHISEGFYKKHAWITALKKSDAYSHPKAHEILSYFIVKSKRFGDFLSEIKRACGDVDPYIKEIENTEIAELILGRAPKNKDYLGKIINGPFDADKLDYIARDSYFTGLRLTTDIERLFYALDVGTIDGKATLYATISGLTALEQILFSKIQLYSCLYHHQKVRAADALLHNFLRYLKDHWGSLKATTQMVKPDNPMDYLKYTDFDFLNVNLHGDLRLQNIIKNLRTRNLPLKALVISDLTVEKDAGDEGGLLDFISAAQAPNWEEKKLTLQRNIYDQILPAFRPGNVDDIIIDVPEPPPLNEAELTLVKVGEGKFERMSKLYKTTHDWLDTYIANKWRAHIFCPDKPRDLQKIVYKEAKDVLEAEIGLKFNHYAETLANHRS